MLLADGQNDCGDVAQAMASLQASGIIFRHETVGFGITPNSRAAQDLRQVATQTGGTYHHAADASQFADVFMEFVDTLTVIDMLGMFGRGSQGPPASPGPGDHERGESETGGRGGSGQLAGRLQAQARTSGSAGRGVLRPSSVGVAGHRFESRAGVGVVHRLSDCRGRGPAGSFGVRRPVPDRNALQRRMRGVRGGPGAGQHGPRMGERVQERCGGASQGARRVPGQGRDIVHRAVMGLHAAMTWAERWSDGSWCDSDIGRLGGGSAICPHRWSWGMLPVPAVPARWRRTLYLATLDSSVRPCARTSCRAIARAVSRSGGALARDWPRRTVERPCQVERLPRYQAAISSSDRVPLPIPWGCLSF